MSDTVDLSQYHLTFDDEFNSFNQDLPAGSRNGTWDTSFGLGPSARNLGHGEQEIYVDPQYQGLGINPFSDQNGVLTISANPTPPPDVSALGGYQYSSGMITTQNTWSQEYGYFEMRAQLPAGQGLWPAFWMVPVSNNTGGEIDVFEQLGNNPGVVHQTVHDPNAGGAGQMFDVPVQSDDGFHTYSVMWTPTTMTFYVDGQETGTRANTINQPMYLISNLALGGSWGGPVDSTTPVPTQMKIDYIRAYSTDPNIPAVGSNPPASSGSSAASTSAPSSASSITFHVGEDVYGGDATFHVLVDGKQVGDEYTVTAQHSDDQWQDIVANIQLTSATEMFQVLDDDKSGVTASTDRNLYVGYAMVNGHKLTPDVGSLFTQGATATFNLTGYSDIFS